MFKKHVDANLMWAKMAASTKNLQWNSISIQILRLEIFSLCELFAVFFHIFLSKMSFYFNNETFCAFKITWILKILDFAVIFVLSYHDCNFLQFCLKSAIWLFWIKDHYIRSQMHLLIKIKLIFKWFKNSEN